MAHRRCPWEKLSTLNTTWFSGLVKILDGKLMTVSSMNSEFGINPV